MGLDLADLSLAQTNNQDDGVLDILTGSAYYYDIVMGKIVREDSGPVAVNSKFGWVLSGRSTNASQGNNT